MFPLIGLHNETKEAAARMNNCPTFQRCKGQFEDLQAVKLQNENLRAFINEWELCLVGIKDVPPKNILESMFRGQLELSKKCKDLANFDFRLATNGPILGPMLTQMARSRRVD